MTKFSQTFILHKKAKKLNNKKKKTKQITPRRKEWLTSTFSGALAAIYKQSKTNNRAG